MVEESSPLVRPAEESIEAETDIALEPEPESWEVTPEPTSEPDFVCDCEEWMRSACDGLPFYKELESQRYCVLHYPGKEKSADFKAALDSKLSKKDFDFRGVWFPDEVDFSGFEFSATADFRDATFSADATFSHAKFSEAAAFGGATFSADSLFISTTFCADAEFITTTFTNAADFIAATFSERAKFSYATFCADAGFTSAMFIGVATFSSATFSGVAVFLSATFSARADFSFATFSAALFGDATFKEAAVFSNATFSADADFNSAEFNDASFGSATFSSTASFQSATFSTFAYFSGATFSAAALFSSATFSADANFSKATFSDADFNLSVFHAHADFSRASFNDSIHFFGSATDRLLKDGAGLAAWTVGKNPRLDFQHVRVEHPDRIAFHTLILRPHWFVNVDPREFVFTDVSWDWERTSIKQEIAALEAKSVSSPNRLLAIACRQLAENAEANNRYEEASNFRYWAMDLARRTKWNGWSFWKTDWLHMLYWAVSGYGERIRNALGVLAAVWFVFVLLYTRVGFAQQPPKASNEVAASVTATSMTIEDRIGQPLEFSRALTYSLAVMSLQKPDPKPLTGTAQALVLLETILGPVQAALLALAIRRKFMR